jgi:hypothetical protein
MDILIRCHVNNLLRHPRLLAVTQYMHLTFCSWFTHLVFRVRIHFFCYHTIASHSLDFFFCPFVIMIGNLMSVALLMYSELLADFELAASCTVLSTVCNIRTVWKYSKNCKGKTCAINISPEEGRNCREYQRNQDKVTLQSKSNFCKGFLIGPFFESQIGSKLVHIYYWKIVR